MNRLAREVVRVGQSGIRLKTTPDQATEAGFAANEIIAEKYRVERVIGEGAMGIVLAATHLDLGEVVAIKFIRREMQEVPGVVSRFAREAKAAVRIKSEYMANVLDVGVSPSLGPYIVMEYLDGKDLADHMAECGRLSIRRAAEYVMQACEALAIAHASGITHRDIKPENLFLTRHGELEIIKVLDFGISKATLTGSVFGDDLTVLQTSCLMGTPLYMSPEQIRATAEVDHRTDIWSLGAVLYELLTGKTAFVGETVTQMCAMVLETDPQPLDLCCPEASPELLAVVNRCLHKDPAGRFQNVAELAFALLPFAPSRARMHAERSTSVLRASGIPVESGHGSCAPAATDDSPVIHVPALGRLPIGLAPELELSRHPMSAERVVAGAYPARPRWRAPSRVSLGALAISGLLLAGVAVLARGRLGKAQTSTPSALSSQRAALSRALSSPAPPTPTQSAAASAVVTSRTSELSGNTAAASGEHTASTHVRPHSAQLASASRPQSARSQAAHDGSIPTSDRLVEPAPASPNEARLPAGEPKPHLDLVVDRPRVKLVE